MPIIIGTIIFLSENYEIHKKSVYFHLTAEQTSMFSHILCHQFSDKEIMVAYL